MEIDVHSNITVSHAKRLAFYLMGENLSEAEAEFAKMLVESKAVVASWEQRDALVAAGFAVYLYDWNFGTDHLHLPNGEEWEWGFYYYGGIREDGTQEGGDWVRRTDYPYCGESN